MQNDAEGLAGRCIESESNLPRIRRIPWIWGQFWSPMRFTNPARNENEMISGLMYATILDGYHTTTFMRSPCMVERTPSWSLLATGRLALLSKFNRQMQHD